MLRQLFIVICSILLFQLSFSMELRVDPAISVFNVLSEHIKNHSQTMPRDMAAIDILKIYEEDSQIWPALLLEVEDDQGNNILHLAFKYHCSKLIDYLVCNNFPLWRKNKQGETVYEVCCHNQQCEKCGKVKAKFLPEKNDKKIKRESIVNRHASLNLEFRIAQKYGAELAQHDLEKIIEDLINVSKFHEASNLITLNPRLDLENSLKKAIIKWKEYPQNPYIANLIQLLLANSSDKYLQKTDIDASFQQYPTLKMNFNKFVKIRNDSRQPKRSHSFFNKIVVVSTLSIIAGLMLYKMKNSNRLINLIDKLKK